MKTTVSESKLYSIISESIVKELSKLNEANAQKDAKKEVNEDDIKGYIKNLVRESLFDMMSNGGQFESSEESDKEEPSHDNSGESHGDEEDEAPEQKKRREIVIAHFKKDCVNDANYAYRLYGITPEEGTDTNEMKNARGKFEKCLYGKPNDSGYPYSFTSKEINDLYSMMSNDSR